MSCQRWTRILFSLFRTLCLAISIGEFNSIHMIRTTTTAIAFCGETLNRTKLTIFWWLNRKTFSLYSITINVIHSHIHTYTFIRSSLLLLLYEKFLFNFLCLQLQLQPMVGKCLYEGTLVRGEWINLRYWKHLFYDDFPLMRRGMGDVYTYNKNDDSNVWHVMWCDDAGDNMDTWFSGTHPIGFGFQWM